MSTLPRPLIRHALPVLIRRRRAISWEPARAASEVTRRADEQGIRTSRGNPWRSAGMARKLASRRLRFLDVVENLLTSGQ